MPSGDLSRQQGQVQHSERIALLLFFAVACWLVPQIVLTFMADWQYCHKHFAFVSVMEIPQKMLSARHPAFERNGEAGTPSFLSCTQNKRECTPFLLGITDVSGSWWVLFFLSFFLRIV